MPFDTNQLGSAKDYSTYNNIGYLFGPAWTPSGKVGGGYSFDGLDDYIEIPHQSQYNFGSGDLTIQLWVKYNSLSGEQILAEKFFGGGGPGWTFTKLVTNVLRFHGCGNAICIDVPASLSANTWHNIAITRGGPVFTVYLDGNQIGSASNFNALTSTDNPLFLGRRNHQAPGGIYYFFNGVMDEVRLYNRALSPQQIYQNYLEGLQGRQPLNIISQELRSGETWQVAVTPNNRQQDGQAVLSNAVLIR